MLKYKIPLKIFLYIFLFLILIQFIPYGKNLTNPAIKQEPKWDCPRTRELFMKSCRDCHSNESVYRWYVRIAPVSWLAQYDVDKGREHLNISEWDLSDGKGYSSENMIKSGEMPPWFHLIPHPEMRLSEEEKKELIIGLDKSFRK